MDFLLKSEKLQEEYPMEGKMEKEEIRKKWESDPEYRAQAVRELEKKYPKLKLNSSEFGNIVY